jgi:hypothetical protein
MRAAPGPLVKNVSFYAEDRTAIRVRGAPVEVVRGQTVIDVNENEVVIHDCTILAGSEARLWEWRARARWAWSNLTAPFRFARWLAGGRP